MTYYTCVESAVSSQLFYYTLASSRSSILYFKDQSQIYTVPDTPTSRQSRHHHPLHYFNHRYQEYDVVRHRHGATHQRPRRRQEGQEE